MFRSYAMIFWKKHTSKSSTVVVSVGFFYLLNSNMVAQRSPLQLFIFFQSSCQPSSFETVNHGFDMCFDMFWPWAHDKKCRLRRPEVKVLTFKCTPTSTHTCCCCRSSCLNWRPAPIGVFADFADLSKDYWKGLSFITIVSFAVNLRCFAPKGLSFKLVWPSLPIKYHSLYIIDQRLWIPSR